MAHPRHGSQTPPQSHSTTLPIQELGIRLWCAVNSYRFLISYRHCFTRYIQPLLAWRGLDPHWQTFAAAVATAWREATADSAHDPLTPRPGRPRLLDELAVRLWCATASWDAGVSYDHYLRRHLEPLLKDGRRPGDFWYQLAELIHHTMPGIPELVPADE